MIKVNTEKLNSFWPNWQVVEQLGKGSFGKVYKLVRAEHILTSYAAMKVVSIPQNNTELESVRAEGLDESGTRSYFEGIVTNCVNEIKLMESMKGNTNIVSIEDCKVLEKRNEIGWDIFIRMELLTPLNSYIADKQLTEAEIRKLGQDICSALNLCTQLNIIHRDIKPENIFVSPFGDFKIGDFGVARELGMSGSLSQKGTYNYVAPEVVTSKHYDATVDIYSLGLVLYKLLNNNRIPFLNPHTQLIQYEDRKIAIERRLNGEPLSAPVNASPYMAQIISKACAFEPAERFQTPFDFSEALGATTGVMPHAINVNFDETTLVRHTPQVAQDSKPTQTKKSEPATMLGISKAPKAKRLLVPSCMIFIVTVVIVGFFVMNRRNDISNGDDTIYIEGVESNGEDTVYAEDIDEAPEALEILRLIDVSRAMQPYNIHWISDTDLLPRKIDESGNANSTYTSGLRARLRGSFSSSTLTWTAPHPYLSFDVGVTGSGGAVIYIRPVNAEEIIWERTIPPGQVVNVRNLSVSGFGGITIRSRAANDQRDIHSWILDPVLSTHEVPVDSAQDSIIGVLELPTPTYSAP